MTTAYFTIDTLDALGFTLHTSKGLSGQLARELVKEGAIERASKRQYQFALEVVLANCLDCLNSEESLGKPVYVCYHRGIHYYPKMRHYYLQDLRYKPLISTIDRLQQLGYLICHTGFKDAQTGIGFLSNFTPTAKLAKLFYTHSHTATELPTERIILRDSTGKLKDYIDTLEIEQWRKECLTWDAIASKHSWQLALPLDIQPTDIDKLVNLGISGTPFLPDPTLIDVSSLFNGLRRVFVDSFKGHGRFYVLAQGIPAKTPNNLRQYLTIDGKPTLEADYQALHLHLAYFLTGSNYTGLDPYSIALQCPRLYVKKLSLIMLNASSEASAIRAYYSECPNSPVKAADLIQAIQEAHPQLASIWYSNASQTLQYLDSQIAAKVIARFNDLSKPILPLHDGFRVMEEDIDTLKDAMDCYYTALFGIPSPAIKVSK